MVEPTFQEIGRSTSPLMRKMTASDDATIPVLSFSKGENVVSTAPVVIYEKWRRPAKVGCRSHLPGSSRDCWRTRLSRHGNRRGRQNLLGTVFPCPLPSRR